MAKLLRRLRYWLHRGNMDAELAEEMEFHRAMLAKDGAAPAAMGNTTLAREDARGVWIWPWLESLWQDVAYGMRTMRRQPAFTITALMALGSAIGSTPACLRYSMLSRCGPGRSTIRAHVVTVAVSRAKAAAISGSPSTAISRRIRRAFSGLIVFRNGERVKIEDHPQQLTYVSGNYFQRAWCAMERGRGFLDKRTAQVRPRP